MQEKKRVMGKHVNYMSGRKRGEKETDKIYDLYSGDKQENVYQKEYVRHIPIWLAFLYVAPHIRATSLVH